MDITFTQILDLSLLIFIFFTSSKILKGTRAFSILIGILVCLIIYYISSIIKLPYIVKYLNILEQHFFIIILVLFQEELRRFFSELGRKFLLIKKISVTKPKLQEELIDILINVGFDLSKQKIGSLIVLEQDIPLDNYKETGSTLDADINYLLIHSLFMNASMLHDGAMIINLDQKKILCAGAVLPLSKNPQTDKTNKLGTRHRAALGLSETTDALIILTSEESGELKLIHKGTITLIKNKEELRQILHKEKHETFWKKVKNLFNI